MQMLGIRLINSLYANTICMCVCVCVLHSFVVYFPVMLPCLSDHSDSVPSGSAWQPGAHRTPQVLRQSVLRAQRARM